MTRSTPGIYYVSESEYLYKGARRSEAVPYGERMYREKGNGSDREWDRREGTDVTKGNRR